MKWSEVLAYRETVELTARTVSKWYDRPDLADDVAQEIYLNLRALDDARYQIAPPLVHKVCFEKAKEYLSRYDKSWQVQPHDLNEYTNKVTPSHEEYILTSVTLAKLMTVLTQEERELVEADLAGYPTDPDKLHKAHYKLGVAGGATRNCPRCGEIKPLQQFYPRRNAYECKACAYAKSREYIERNRDKVRAKRRQWYLKNRDKEIENARRRKRYG